MAALSAALRPSMVVRLSLAAFAAALLPRGRAAQLLRGGVAGADDMQGAGELAQNTAGAHEGVNPVTKVVQMLQEMKETVEADAKEDADVFAKHNCWCETNERQKTEAIARAKTRIEELQAFIEEGTALVARLAEEIEGLKAEIKEDQEALEKATVIREEERADFESEEKDGMECIAALKEAIAVLSKVQLVQQEKKAPSQTQPTTTTAPPTTPQMALPQVQLVTPSPQVPEVSLQDMAREAATLDPFALAQVRRAVERVSRSITEGPANRDAARMGTYRAVMQKDLWDMLGGISGGLRTLTELTQQGQQQPIGGVMGAKSYNARSGQILGILTQMLDSFSANLKAAQKQEVAAEIAFQRLSAVKMKEIMVATQAVEEKSAQVADLQAKVAQAKEDIASTKEALAADEAFLADLKVQCETASADFDERTQTRAEEVQAIAEAITILTQDDARDIFSRTVSFLQLGQTRRQPTAWRAVAALQTQEQAQESARERMGVGARAAADKLMTVARKHWGTATGWQLAQLAVSAHNDGLEKVKEMMDKMVADLKQQDKDEYEKRETCVKDIDANEDAERAKQRERKDLEAQISALNATVEELQVDIKDLQKQVADAHVALKVAGEARKAEDQEFQQTVADQRATAEIIGKAVERLKSFYSKKAALLGMSETFLGERSDQEPGKASSPRPSAGKDYKRHGGGLGVIGTLELIIQDAKAAEAEAIKAEQKAQSDYASLVANTNSMTTAVEASIIQKSAAIKRAEAEVLETRQGLRMVEDALLEIGDQGVALHLSCDWLLKNYQIRWQARQEEISAIQEAKAILSGADFSFPGAPSA